MKYWITTDTHFGHKMLFVKGYRPIDFDDLIKKDFRRINNGDVLIHLGDFAFDKTKLTDFLDKNITSILVVGNHDKKSIESNRKIGFNFAVRSFELKIFGKKVRFSHRPSRKIENIDIEFHGHTHGNVHREEEYENFYDPQYHRELALEHNNFELWDLEELIKNPH